MSGLAFCVVFELQEGGSMLRRSRRRGVSCFQGACLSFIFGEPQGRRQAHVGVSSFEDGLFLCVRWF